MRRTHTVLAFLLLAGCQRGDSFHSTPEQPTITETKADAITHAATLKAADLPGYRQTRVEGEMAYEVNPTDCVKYPTKYVASRTASYERGPVGIVSSVEIAPTIGQVREDFLQMLDDALIPCLKQEMANAAVREGYAFTDIAVRRFDVLVRQSDGGFGAATRAIARKGAARVSVHVVSVNAIVGHAEISIIGVATGRDAPSEATLKALLAKAVKRARAVV